MAPVQLRRLAAFQAVVLALLVLPASTVDAAPSLPELSPTMIYFTEPTIAGQTVYFDAGIQNDGGQDTGVFNIKWFVDNQDVGAYGSHEGVPSHSSKSDGNSQFSHTFDDSGSIHTVTFVVDVDNFVTEGHEGNNSVSVDVWVD